MKFTLNQSYAVNRLISLVPLLGLYMFIFLPGWRGLYSLSLHRQLPSTLISPGHLQLDSYILGLGRGVFFVPISI